MNIEGVVRQLPLFEPPIDPALLVRAPRPASTCRSVLNDLSAPLPHYRFAVLSAEGDRALQPDGEVAGAGAAGARSRRRDAEALALLRANHEVATARGGRAR